MRALRSFGFALSVLVGGACSSNNVLHIVGHGDGTDDGGTTAGDDGGTLTDDAGNPILPDGALIPVGPTTGVKVLVEPNGNNASELVAAINAATISVHMTMYLFSSSDVEAALIAKKKAGLDVKVILNQNFPGGGGTNQAMFTDLGANHIPVVWAPIDLTHEKCVIIDGKTAWIMTMNTTQTSAQTNREYVAIDHDLDDVVEAEAIFEADYAHTPAPISGKLVVAPVNARARLVALINSATTTLDIEGEEFADPAITDAVDARGDAGVKVRLIVADNAPSSGQASAISFVKNHHGKVVSVSSPYIHAKAIVVDGKEMYVGSANFSTASLSYNRELGLITNTASEVALVAAAINKDFAAGTAL